MVQFNVIVCGGGLGGIASAIALKRKGHNVTILESAAQLNEVGAGIQIPPNSVKILKGYGILDKFLPFITKPKNINLRRYNTGEIISRTPLDPDMTDNYGNPYLLIHRIRLLYEAATEMGVAYKTNSRSVSVDQCYDYS